MITGLLAMVLITLTDPSGDARGDGTLLPPTAAVYRSLSAVDLLEVGLLAEDTLGLTITMGSLANPLDLPNGFSMPIIEVYLDTVEGGSEELLAGSGLRLPQGSGWEYALRLTGEDRHLFSAGETGTITEHREMRIELSTDGQTLTVQTPVASPKEAQIFAIVGLYDTFALSPWRPISQNASPWAFSSPNQRYPVVDVLAEDIALQRQTLTTGVLPLPDVPAQDSRWFVLMGAGIVLAMLGVAARLLSRAPVTQTTAGAQPSHQTIATRAAETSETLLGSEFKSPEASKVETGVAILGDFEQTEVGIKATDVAADSTSEASSDMREEPRETTDVAADPTSEASSDMREEPRETTDVAADPTSEASSDMREEPRETSGHTEPEADSTLRQELDGFSKAIETLEEASLELMPATEPPAAELIDSTADEDWGATWSPDEAPLGKVSSGSSELRVESSAEGSEIVEQPDGPATATDDGEYIENSQEEERDELNDSSPIEPGLRERAKLMIAIDRAESKPAEVSQENDAVKPDVDQEAPG